MGGMKHWEMKLIFLSAVGSLGTCNPDSLSCPAEGVDGCCTPAAGSIVLAQQWISNLGPEDAFTLHGLWPNYCNGSFTPFRGCDIQRAYTNISQIVQSDPDLYAQMQIFWPSYKGNVESFWSHEWRKHGTCLSTVEPKCLANSAAGQDALAYFRLALENRERFDLYKTLASQSILPGRSYPKEDILKALVTLGASSVLICKGDKLQEVRSNFHVKGSDNYMLVDNNARSNCPSTITYERKLALLNQEDD